MSVWASPALSLVKGPFYHKTQSRTQLSSWASPALSLPKCRRTTHNLNLQPHHLSVFTSNYKSITPLSSWAEPAPERSRRVEGKGRRTEHSQIPSLPPNPINNPIVSLSWACPERSRRVEDQSWVYPELSLPWACRREGKGREGKGREHTRYRKTQSLVKLSVWACRRPSIAHNTVTKHFYLTYHKNILNYYTEED